MTRDGDRRRLAELATSARTGRLSNAEVEFGLRAVLATRDREQRIPAEAAEVAVRLLDNTPALHAAIREVLLSPDDVADAMQETLLAVCRSINGFDGRSSLQTWAVTIARRKAVDVLRRKQSRAPNTDVQAEVDETTRFSSQWATYADVAAALEGLSPRLRRVFDLAEMQGLTYHEIAARLGIPRNTMASRLRRARAQLQIAMGPM